MIANKSAVVEAEVTEFLDAHLSNAFNDMFELRIYSASMDSGPSGRARLHRALVQLVERAAGRALLTGGVTVAR